MARVTAARWDVAMLQRDYAAAKKILEMSAVNELSYATAGLTPKIFLEGCTYLARGDNAAAQKAFEQVQTRFRGSRERSTRIAPSGTRASAGFTP